MDGFFLSFFLSHSVAFGFAHRAERERPQGKTSTDTFTRRNFFLLFSSLFFSVPGYVFSEWRATGFSKIYFRSDQKFNHVELAECAGRTRGYRFRRVLFVIKKKKVDPWRGDELSSTILMSLSIYFCNTSWMARRKKNSIERWIITFVFRYKKRIE